MLDVLKNDRVLLKTVEQYLKHHYWETAPLFQMFELNEATEISKVRDGFDVYICFENIELLGLIATSGNGLVLVHFLDERVKSKYHVLTTLKKLNPNCLKGDPKSVEIAKSILAKSILAQTDELYDWMAFNASKQQMVSHEELLNTLKQFAQEGLSVLSADEVPFQDMIPFLLEVEKCFNRNPLSINQLKKKMAQRIECEAYLVACWKGKVIGQGLLEYALPEHKLIGGLYTESKYRRKGIGRLMTTALSHAVLNMELTPALTVEENNKNAIHLYQSLGFEFVGKQQNTLLKLGY